MTALEKIIAAVEAGNRLPTDPWFQVVQSSTLVVMAFPGHNVICGELDPAWVAAQFPDEDLSLPLLPRFLRTLEEKFSRRVNNIDIVMLGEPLPYAQIGAAITDRDHPRVKRALRYRTDVTVYAVEGGVLIIGRGVGGRWEVAVEVDPAARNRGLGRELALAARGLIPDGRPVWAQIAPGNASSVRAFIAAGYSPVGAEALFVP